MRFYEVSDGDEIDRAFASKAEAIRYAKQIDKDAHDSACRDAERWGHPRPPPSHGFLCTVTMITTPPLTLSLLLDVMNGEGYALTQTTVWPEES